MAAPKMRITNLYDNTLEVAMTPWGQPNANAKDPQPGLVVTLADASTVNIPAGQSVVVALTGTKAFSSVAQAASNAEFGGKSTDPVNIG